MAEGTLVSIITVVRNGGEFIERSIQSVVNQEYQSIEYIIVDGNSTDDTIEIIEKYTDKISCWISESDRGIYDAMNKGIKLSHGKWIFFLGCDDYLIDNQAIKKLLSHESDNLMMIFGNVVYSNGYSFKSSLNTSVLISNSVHHQSCIYRSVLFSNFSYDASIKVYADYELNLISFLKKHEFYYVDENISFCQIGGVSSTSKKNAIAEVNSIRGKYLNMIMNAFISKLYYLIVTLVEFKQAIIKYFQYG